MTLPTSIDTVVIGAGQSGLTMSRYLQRAGREHVVLERRAELGGGWRDRWDGFRLVGPNWTASFLDAPYDGDDPDGFMPRDEIAARVARYATSIDAPVALETAVERLRVRGPRSFALDTTQGSIAAREVIVATGGFHVPYIPAVAAGLSPAIRSLHVSDYRRPSDLPAGGVLVVGSGQTGVQIAEELQAAGREVVLSIGTAGRVPRRYRGRDIFHWLAQIVTHGDQYGTTFPTPAELPDPRRRLAGNPHLSGHGGGHEVNLRALARDGITLVGHIAGIDGRTVTFADDLSTNLAAADRFFADRFQGLIDDFIAAARVDVPPAEEPVVVDHEPRPIDRLDLVDRRIGSVVWTSGFRQDLGWIEPSITDAQGFARQTDGLSEVPGLSFIGSHWQHDQMSSTLFGMPRDARLLAGRLGLLTEAGSAGQT
jgi:putative flavoprotein involved in K+ transport